MPKFIKNRETIVWILLLLLTLLSFYFAEAHFSNKKTIGASILLVAGVKFSLIFHYFMELAEAHILWRGVMYSFLVFVLGGVFILL